MRLRGDEVGAGAQRWTLDSHVPKRATGAANGPRPEPESPESRRSGERFGRVRMREDGPSRCDSIHAQLSKRCVCQLLLLRAGEGWREEHATAAADAEAFAGVYSLRGMRCSACATIAVGCVGCSGIGARRICICVCMYVRVESSRLEQPAPLRRQIALIERAAHWIEAGMRRVNDGGRRGDAARRSAGVAAAHTAEQTLQQSSLFHGRFGNAAVDRNVLAHFDQEGVSLIVMTKTQSNQRVLQQERAQTRAQTHSARSTQVCEIRNAPCHGHSERSSAHVLASARRCACCTSLFIPPRFQTCERDDLVRDRPSTGRAAR